MKCVAWFLLLAAFIFARPVTAETNACTAITVLPTVITNPGIYCLDGDLASSATNGDLVEIQSDDVTIDLNGFNIDGFAAGASTEANGIHAVDRKNIKIHNGLIRGFFRGIWLEQVTAGESHGHLIENLRFFDSRRTGIRIEGSGNVVRNNHIIDTGSSDIKTTAIGLGVRSASNSLIANNVISGTSQSGSATGIKVLDSALIEVRANSIYDSKLATNIRSIHVLDSSDITIGNNLILNASGTGTVGVAIMNSTAVNCIDNTIYGFGIAHRPCDFEAGNHTP